MSRILKQTSVFHILDKPIDNLTRINQRIPNKEALRLYRDVLKFCKHFDWKDSRGMQWSYVLKRCARMELESSREETDPVKLGQMLIAGREALSEATNRFNKKQYDFVKHVDSTRTDKAASSAQKKH